MLKSSKGNPHPAKNDTTDKVYNKLGLLVFFFFFLLSPRNSDSAMNLSSILSQYEYMITRGFIHTGVFPSQQHEINILRESDKKNKVKMHVGS
jgi:hypothetical protein